jgi:hypothetical protein
MAETAEVRKRQGFPLALLEQPNAVRLDYFKAYTVAHPALKQADQAVWNALREPAGALLVFIYGSTGVGKTTLLAHIQKRLLEYALLRLEHDRGQLPVVRLDAVASSTPEFKWGDFSKRALMSVEEPLLDYKVDYQRLIPAPLEKHIQPQALIPRSGGDLAEWRLVWEQVLKNRKPVAVLIDEAQHLAKGRGSKLIDQLDHLKSLAVMSQTVHVLAGTYDLLVLRNLSAQLSRRSIDVHFSRYHLANKDEVRAFKSVLLAFQQHLPLEEEPDLIQQWEYCYARTIGCIGVLKDWLTKAFAEAVETGAKTLSPALLQRHALSVDRCEQMLTESEEGEKQLTDDEKADDRLRIRLGLERPPAKKSRHDAHPVQAEEHSAQPSPRVGQRKPKRDPLKKERETREEHGG